MKSSLAVVSLILTISSAVPQEPVYSIPLKSIKNAFGRQQDGYIAEVGIGAPRQISKLMFNTCARDMLVQSAKCSITDVPCLLGGKSSTYQKDGTPCETKLGSRTYRGHASNVTLTLREEQVGTQPICEITRREGARLGEVDGVLGAHPGSSSPNLGMCALLENMQRQGLINQTTFKIRFNNGPTSRAGEVILGGYRGDDSSEGFVVDISKEGCWQFKVDEISVSSSYKTCEDSCKFNMDTTTRFIEGPKDQIRRINNLIKARKALFSGRYTADCVHMRKDRLPIIYIKMNSQEFALSADEYIVDHERNCYSIFAEHDSDELREWNIGTYFMSMFDMRFDCEKMQLGFDPATRRN